MEAEVKFDGSKMKVRLIASTPADHVILGLAAFKTTMLKEDGTFEIDLKRRE